MAYIRLETLVKELEENPFTMSICMTADECKGMNRARSLIAEVVKDIAAEDVQPVVHGRWVGFPECLKYPNAYSDDHIVCSSCEECFSVLDNCTERFDYCPHCGAKMDLEN